MEKKKKHTDEGCMVLLVGSSVSSIPRLCPLLSICVGTSVEGVSLCKWSLALVE